MSLKTMTISKLLKGLRSEVEAAIYAKVIERVFHLPPLPTTSRLFLLSLRLWPQSTLTWSPPMSSVPQHNSSGGLPLVDHTIKAGQAAAALIGSQIEVFNPAPIVRLTRPSPALCKKGRGRSDLVQQPSRPTCPMAARDASQHGSPAPPTQEFPTVWRKAPATS
jgi:hypothetical protein